MKITIGGHTVPWYFTAEDGLVDLSIDGKPILGIDFAYLDPEWEDPAQGETWGPSAPGPHIVIGYWLDDDDGTWVRVLEVAAPQPDMRD